MADDPSTVDARLTPARIALLYLGFGAVWIVLSDWAVTRLFGLSALSVQAQLVKGLLFVAGSGVFIYLLVARRDREIREKVSTLQRARSRADNLESAVDESEQFLELVLANITDTVLLTDESGAITYVCPNVHHIFGRSKSDVEAMGTVEALLGEDIPLEDLGEDGIVENVEREVVDADGEAHTVLVTVKAVSMDAGTRLYTVHDITDRRRQEERFRTYVEHSSDVITVIDADGTVEYVSPSVRRVFGRDPDDLVGSDAFRLIHPDDRAHLESTFRRVGESEAGAMVSVEYRTSHADGSWVWTESRITARGDEHTGAYVVNSRDISELKEREARLSVLDRVLRHNLRNKLNVVLGTAENLRAREGDSDGAIDVIVDASKSLLDLAEKARRFDASIRDRLTAAEPLDVVDCVETVVADEQAEYPEATFETDLPDAAHAIAHEAFELALAELVDNAVKHTDRDHPTVSITVSVEDASIEITVADDGPGLPDRHREPLLRGEETPLEHSQGLGLWLARWTVDNSGGSFDVHRNEPRGTVVELTLPRVEPG